MRPFAPDFGSVQPVPFGVMMRDHGQAKAGDPARPGRRAFLTRIHRRRFSCLQAASEAVDILPAEGEAVHIIMSGYFDLMHLLIVFLERFGSPCTTLRIGTLSLSRRNVQAMVALFDAGKVRCLDLLTSDFFRKHDDDIFAELVREFHTRGQRVAAARSHCKLVTMALEDGRRYVAEGSPNLRTNKNAEQVCLSRDSDLHRFYDGWLDGMVSAHEIRQSDASETS